MGRAKYGFRPTKKSVKIPAELSQFEYEELYRVIKRSLEIARSRPNGYGMNFKYRALLIAQRDIAHRNGKVWNVPRNNIYNSIRDARRAMENPTLSKLNGARIVSDIFDMIDNISGTKPADVESGMVELKDAVRNMNQLNEEAKVVSGKCEVIANNLSNICKYMNGDVDELSVEQK